jgi:hypothetical protein
LETSAQRPGDGVRDKRKATDSLATRPRTKIRIQTGTVSVGLSAAAIKVPLPPLELTEPGTAEGGGGAEAVKQAGSAIKGLFGGDKK